MVEVDIYRVQRGKPWYRRTWQAEWDGCLWASRGYTRRGVVGGAWVRRHWGRIDRLYVRAWRIVRRNVTGDRLDRRMYDRLGRVTAQSAPPTRWCDA